MILLRCGIYSDDAPFWVNFHRNAMSELGPLSTRSRPFSRHRVRSVQGLKQTRAAANTTGGTAYRRHRDIWAKTFIGFVA